MSETPMNEKEFILAAIYGGFGTKNEAQNYIRSSAKTEFFMDDLYVMREPSTITNIGQNPALGHMYGLNGTTTKYRNCGLGGDSQ